MLNEFGWVILTVGPSAAIRHGGRLAPRWGQRMYELLLPGAAVCVAWQRGSGYRLHSIAQGRRREGVPRMWRRPEVWTVPIKRRVPLAEPVPIPALSVATKHLAKVPHLLEFVSATAYEDGAKREPGYITLRNRYIEWEVTLYDPDAGARLPVRGRTLDDVLQLVEQLLVSADVQWEADHYLMDRLKKKPRKK